jgi:DNA-binding XRE family transcriptional regulator
MSTKASLSQNPHQARDRKEKVLEIAIGRAIRGLRRQQGITVADLAERTGLSRGMLSKIENGNISPSLSTLQSLASALGVPLTSFLRGYEETRYVSHTKAGESVEVNRAGTRAGHQYNLLGHLKSVASGVVVEPYMITLSEKSDTFPTFQHDGVEMIYMLEGVVEYRHGDSLFRLEAGDTLFFEADAPHGPEDLIELPAKYLSVISYRQSK